MDLATTELLIEAVKQYPSLYDKDHASRTNIDQKNLIWNEIANKLDKPVERCKSKWRNLRDSYLKAVKYKHELSGIGKLSIYRGYKHEDALSFLETSSLKKRRSSTDGRSRHKKRKESDYEAEYNEDQQDYATSEAIEFIVETERNTTSNDDEENSMESTLRDEEALTQETEKEAGSIKTDPEQHLYPFENTGNMETTSNGEMAYQEVFATDSVIQNSVELDPWLAGVKETLMSLPKLIRARAKKQINDLVSDYEIKYLESLENIQ